MQASEPISLWDNSATENDHDNSLDDDLKVDIAVVGGGFTGLSTALHAAVKGHDCAVLESQRLGHGGSGRNVGLVNAGLWLPPREVRAKLGEKRGAHLINVLGAAPDHVFSLIGKYRINCEQTRTATIHAAHSPAGFRDLARRAEEWQSLGAPVVLLSKEEAAEKIGSRAFHGGLLDHRAGTINPMGYVRGLARAAKAEGARIFTRTPAISLKRSDGLWRVDTGRAIVTARNVVICSNAYSDNLWPGLKDTFIPINFFQIATEPLGSRADHILKEGQGLWDTGTIMFSLRRDAFGRLIAGSMGSVLGSLSKRWAAKRLRRLFPELGTVALETAWQGSIAMTPEHLPRICRLAEGVYAPIGYSGRGIAPGTMFGKAMAELLSGGSEDDLPLPVSGLRPAPFRRTKSGFFKAVFAANQVMQGI